MTARPDKFRILVVDDEEDICEILQYNLQNAGYIADVASSSEEALFKMKNNYHLLLLDIMMDGISGLKLAQLLREDYNNNVPIIFISALDTESDIISAFNKGGDDYIAKPFSIKEVLARVNAVLNRTYNNLPDEKPASTTDKKEISKITGQKKSNIKYFKEKFGIDLYIEEMKKEREEKWILKK